MPLPADNVPWPPKTDDTTCHLYKVWSAWFSGEPDKLTEAYDGAFSTLNDPKQLDAAKQRSFSNRLRERYFWGNRSLSNDNSFRAARLHIPLAGDIAATSATLLFGEQLNIRVGDIAAEAAAKAKAASAQPPGAQSSADLVPRSDPSQQRIEMLLNDGGGQAALLEAAEIAAGYGGVYLRVGWDKAVCDHPIIDSIAPDFAVPEWRGHFLTAVTFWREVARDGDNIWRHLERYEPGLIWHGLFKGTDGQLGQRQDLKARPETEPFAALVDASGKVATGGKRLAVEYIPNMRPNRHMTGSPLGRSDYAGITGVMDSLDETWTSWMRDLRLGKARLVVPDEYLQSQGRGKGAAWDPETEVYESVNSLSGTNGMEITQVQFAIRVAEHMQTAKELTSMALRSAGYSAQTFGDNDGPAAATATEIVARSTSSYQTRLRKIGYWRPALIRLLTAWLEIDVAQFKPAGVKADNPPDVQWPDAVAQDIEAAARTVQLLFGAETASLYTRIQMIQPDWDDLQIREEIDRIKQDKAEGLPDMAPLGAGETASGPGEPGPPGQPGGQAEQPGQPPQPAGKPPATNRRPPAKRQPAATSA